MKTFLLICLLYFIYPFSGFSQNDSAVHPVINKKRLTALIISESSVYSLSMIGLYQLWYRDYPQVSFHFFDDSKEWLQMDKAGHVYSSYYLSKLSTEGFLRTGMDKRKSALWGFGTGFLYMTSIEVFDGFSDAWGASAGDMLSNIAGLGLFAGQYYLWSDLRIIPKFSFHATSYSKYRPDLLGSNTAEKILKDYNGQTYWLSVNPSSFSCPCLFPRWLNIAVGYSAEGMTGGKKNPAFSGQQPIPPFERNRQYLLSLDLDWSRIPVKSKVLKTLFYFVNSVKIPFPALELSDKKVYLRGVYF